MGEYSSYEIKDLGAGLVAVFQGAKQYQAIEHYDGSDEYVLDDGKAAFNLATLDIRIENDTKSGCDVSMLEMARSDLVRALEQS